MAPLDFIDRLQDYLDTLGLPCPCLQGPCGERDSLALTPAPGGQTHRVYFDGVRDKQVNVLLRTKIRGDAVLGLTLLSAVAEAVERLAVLPSQNGSYLFQSVAVLSGPELSGSDEGFHFHTMTIQAELTITE